MRPRGTAIVGGGSTFALARPGRRVVLAHELGPDEPGEGEDEDDGGDQAFVRMPPSSPDGSTRSHSTKKRKPVYITT